MILVKNEIIKERINSCIESMNGFFTAGYYDGDCIGFHPQYFDFVLYCNLTIVFKSFASASFLSSRQWAYSATISDNSHLFETKEAILELLFGDNEW